MFVGNYEIDLLNNLATIYKIRKEHEKEFPDSKIKKDLFVSTNMLHIMIVELLNHYFMGNPSYKFIKNESIATFSIFLGPDLILHTKENIESLWNFYTNELVLRKLDLLFN